MFAYVRDGDPPGMHAGRSPGAVTGQRGSAGSRWRRGPVSRFVLVVAVACWRGPRADPPGDGAVSAEVSVGSSVCSSAVIPGVRMLRAALETTSLLIALQDVD